MQTKTLGLLIFLSFIMLGFQCDLGDSKECTDLSNKLSEIAADANRKLGEIEKCPSNPECSDGHLQLLKVEFKGLRAVYLDALEDYVKANCVEDMGAPTPFPSPGETQLL